MVRRRKIKNKTVVGVALIILGLAVVGFSISDTGFPEISKVLPLTFLLNRECDPNEITQEGSVSPGDLECDLNISRFDDDQLPFTKVLPLSAIDTNSPMILDNFYQAGTSSNSACAATITSPLVVTLSDENGILITMPPTGITDIQPLITTQQSLVITMDAVVDDPVACPSGSITYNGGLRLDFFPAPPEINEDKVLLLEQWLYLGDFRDQGVDEPATNIAVAEKFQLENPTVITDLRVMIGTDRDTQTTITAFVWNMDTSPPERITQSEETVTGISDSRAELILDFTFPTTVVLLPTQNNVPINYAVGVKVEQNSGSNFQYTKSDQLANTHECVIDRTANPDAESSFVSNGLCGFDIRHSPFRAFSLLKAAEGTETEDQILDRLAEIENEILSTDDEITRTELTAILCEGITPQPAICQVGLTANSCGVTEFFFEGDCLCNEGYDRIESGDCKLRDSSLLNIGEFSDEELIIIGIGLLILVIGAVVIATITRRR